MLIKYGEGLEFEQDDEPARVSPEPLPPPRVQEEALTEIMRHGFRAPVGQEEAVTVRIGTRVHGVYNLAPRGIGVFLSGEEGYGIGTEFPELELQLLGKSFSLAGKVVHLSQDASGPWLCGIALRAMAPEVEKLFQGYVEKSRSRLFTGRVSSGAGK